MELKCDKCKETFKMDVQEKNHEGGIVETYFVCPQCNEKYIGYVTDEALRKELEDIRKLKKQVESLRKGRQRSILYTTLKKRQDKARRRMEGLERIIVNA